MGFKTNLIGAAVAAVAFAGAASAGTVTVTKQGGSAFGTPNWSKVVGISSPSRTGGVNAGMFRLTGDNGMGDFVAFCVDLADSLNLPETYQMAPTLAPASVMANVDKLFSSAYNSITDSVSAAGFQVALWEIIEDTDPNNAPFDLNSGNFKMTSGEAAVKNAADGFLGGLAGAPTGQYKYTFLESKDGQDLVTVAPVPVPAAGLLLLTGLGGFAALRRRRKS